MQDDAYVSHKDVIVFGDKTKFTSLQFCGPHVKPTGVRGLSKYYNMQLYTELGHGTCEIIQMNCACYECTSMLDKNWNPGLTPRQQPRYCMDEKSDNILRTIASPPPF